MEAIRDTDYTPVSSVPLRSPLAIGGFFIHYLRIRFGEAYTPSWVWRERDEDTELFIISGSTVENEIRNNRPAIFVNVGECSVGNVVVGNNLKTEWLQAKKYSYSRLDMSLTLNCESDNKGESHMLAWRTYTAVIAAQDVLRTKYLISNMGPFSLVPPRPSKKDRETWISTINLALSYELTWNVTAVQTAIKEISYVLDINAESDPTHFLTEIYLGSLEPTHN